jgi:hypothetical protein
MDTSLGDMICNVVVNKWFILFPKSNRIISPMYFHMLSLLVYIQYLKEEKKTKMEEETKDRKEINESIIFIQQTIISPKKIIKP